MDYYTLEELSPHESPFKEAAHQVRVLYLTSHHHRRLCLCSYWASWTPDRPDSGDFGHIRGTDRAHSSIARCRVPRARGIRPGPWMAISPWLSQRKRRREPSSATASAP